MATQKQLDTIYLRMARQFSLLSRAVRLKVGALIVTPTGVIVPGYNGTPPGFDNECEYTDSNGNLVTKPDVIHAEMNAILKAARQGVSLLGSTVYCTHAPCVNCAAKMAGIDFKRFVYQNQYRDTSGIELLEQSGVSVEQITDLHDRVNGRKVEHKYESRLHSEE